MFFDSWAELWRTAIVGCLAYVALVVMLRVSGPRTLAKMNAFDLIVTVALGSTLATALLSKDVALAEGVAAMGLLIGLQFTVTWLSVRSEAASHLVKSEPILLFYRGAFLPAQMRRARVVEGDARFAVRGQGLASLDGIEAIVLESDGSFTVVPDASGDASALGWLPQQAERGKATGA